MLFPRQRKGSRLAALTRMTRKTLKNVFLCDNINTVSDCQQTVLQIVPAFGHFQKLCRLHHGAPGEKDGYAQSENDQTPFERRLPRPLGGGAARQDHRHGVVLHRRRQPLDVLLLLQKTERSRRRDGKRFPLRPALLRGLPRRK